MLRGQGQQAITQGRHRTEQEIPENHREKTLVCLPHQIALHPLQQLLTAVSANIQIALGDMGGRLQVFPAPGITKRPQASEQVAPPQAVDHHQQMHRQGQQAIGHRLQRQ
ncbi:hypothetical protein D3C78_1739810 [compost metagenome]